MPGMRPKGGGVTAPKQWPSRTRDGRELFTAVFRPIPGFGLYEVTVDGDVRNRNTGRLLQETENTRTGAWHYTLWRDGGTKTSRSYASLVRAAWGDTTTEAVPDGAASSMTKGN